MVTNVLPRGVSVLLQMHNTKHAVTALYGVRGAHLLWSLCFPVGKLRQLPWTPEAGCDVALREPSKIGHRVVHCRSLWAFGVWPTKSPAKIDGMRSEAQLSGREAYVTRAHCSFKQWQLVVLKDLCKSICQSLFAAQKDIATAQKGTRHLSSVSFQHLPTTCYSRECKYRRN